MSDNNIAYYAQGLKYFNEGKIVDSIREFQNVISLSPNHYDAHISLARCYNKIERYYEAQKEYKKAIEIDPNKLSAIKEYADLLFRPNFTISDYDEAINILKNTLRLDPDSADAHFRLATVFRHLSDMINAYAEYKKAIGIDPKNVTYLSEFASFLSGYNLKEESIAAYIKLLEFDKNNFNAYIFLIENYKKLDRLDDLNNIVKAFLINLPENAQFVHSTFEYYKKNEKIKFLESMLIGSIEKNPSTFQLNQLLADIYDFNGEQDEAINEYKAAIKKNNGEFGLHYKLAGLLYNKGLLQEALIEYIEAYISNPKDSDANQKMTALEKELKIRTGIQFNDGDYLKVKPIFRGRNHINFENYCFVLMPFSKDHDLFDVYTNHIVPIVSKSGMLCKRADNIDHNKDIMEVVWQQLLDSTIVVADLTGKNPNVYYELGLAHTIGKEVILLSQDLSEVPFDVNHIRVIHYKTTSESLKELDERLFKTINAIRKNL